MSESMRIDKFLANTTGDSRSQIKKAIRQGRVEIAGRTILDPGEKISREDTVWLDGEAIRYQGHRYLMLYKPKGVVSATKDKRHMTVMDLIEEPHKERLHIAGRLDIDTTGLVLITDDGDWSHQITSPNKACNKIYYAQLARPLEESLVERFAQGIWLEQEKRRCLPAQLEILGEYEARLTLSEGRYHQVKRMFAALGNHVDELYREQIGEIVLDANLIEGEYRPLTQDEIDSIY